MAKAVRLLKLEKVLSSLEEKFMIRANVLKVTSLLAVPFIESMFER